MFFILAHVLDRTDTFFSISCMKNLRHLAFNCPVHSHRAGRMGSWVSVLGFQTCYPSCGCLVALLAWVLPFHRHCFTCRDMLEPLGCLLIVQMAEHHPRPSKSESLRMGPRNLLLNILISRMILMHTNTREPFS